MDTALNKLITSALPSTKIIHFELNTPELSSDDDKSLADVASKIFPNLNETLEAIALDNDKKKA